MRQREAPAARAASTKSSRLVASVEARITRAMIGT